MDHIRDAPLVNTLHKLETIQREKFKKYFIYGNGSLAFHNGAVCIAEGGDHLDNF